MKAQLSLLSIALVASLSSAAVDAKDALQFKNVFDFKTAKATQLSENGEILSFSATPYRGDATGQVYTLNNNNYSPKLSVALNLKLIKQVIGSLLSKFLLCLKKKPVKAKTP